MNMYRFLKNNKKVLFAFFLGVLVSSGTVYAATVLYAANQVSYSNTSSGLSATDVQSALDELNTKANSILLTQPTSAPDYCINAGYSLSSTHVTCTGGSDFQCAHWADGSWGLCAKPSSTFATNREMVCVKANDYDYNKIYLSWYYNTYITKQPWKFTPPTSTDGSYRISSEYQVYGFSISIGSKSSGAMPSYAGGTSECYGGPWTSGNNCDHEC